MTGFAVAAPFSIDAPGQKLDCVSWGAGLWITDLAAAILEAPEACAKALCMLCLLSLP